MDILSWILTIILIFYAISWMTRRFFLPLMLRFIANRLQKKMTQHFSQSDPRNTSEQKQSTKQKKATSVHDKLGEYVDFEEIK